MRLLSFSILIVSVLMGCQPDQKQDPAVTALATTNNTDNSNSVTAPELIEPEVIAPVCPSIGWDQILDDAGQNRVHKEEFTTDGSLIVAYEYIGDFIGKWDKLFRFDIMENDCIRAVITVGSYDRINASERAMGRIASTERVFPF